MRHAVNTDPTLRCSLCGDQLEPGSGLADHLAEHEDRLGIGPSQPAPVGTDQDQLNRTRWYAFLEHCRQGIFTAGPYAPPFEIRVWYERCAGYTGSESAWHVLGYASGRSQAGRLTGAVAQCDNLPVHVWRVRPLESSDAPRALMDRYGPPLPEHGGIL